MGELIVNGLKVAIYVGLIATFTTAIITILNLLATITMGGVIGEFFAILGAYLPFNGSAVFTTIGVSCSAILAFMVANKIWSMMNEVINI